MEGVCGWGGQIAADDHVAGMHCLDHYSSSLRFLGLNVIATENSVTKPWNFFSFLLLRRSCISINKHQSNLISERFRPRPIQLYMTCLSPLIVSAHALWLKTLFVADTEISMVLPIGRHRRQTGFCSSGRKPEDLSRR